METRKEKPENVVDNGNSLAFEFLYKAENRVKCLQCGRCTSGCPAAKVFSDYNPREIMRRVQDGDGAELVKDPIIWLCGQCYTCNSRCPRNNSPASIILEARNTAYKEGYAPPEMYERSAALLESLFLKGVTVSPILLQRELGTLTKVIDADELKALRAELGLPQWDSREVAIPARALEEIRTILELTCDKKETANDH